MKKVNVVIEGIDLAGKTTFIRNLNNLYSKIERNYEINYLVNPPKEINRMVREKDISIEERDALFMEGFRQNDKKLIEGLNISDRSFLTNLAYCTDMERFDNLKSLYINELTKPDLVVIITLDNEVIENRYSATKLDHFEDVDISEIIRRQLAYIKICKDLDINFITIDGSNTLVYGMGRILTELNNITIPLKYEESNNVDLMRKYFPLIKTNDGRLIYKRESNHVATLLTKKGIFSIGTQDEKEEMKILLS